MHILEKYDPPKVSRTITRNAMKCLRCGDVIESRTRHDFVTCSCGNISVDGGLDYFHRVFAQGVSDEDYEDLSEWEEVQDEGSTY